MAIRGWRGEHGWPGLIRSQAALTDLGDDPDIDDVYRRRLVVYFPDKLRLIPPSCKDPCVAPFPGKLTQGPAVMVGRPPPARCA
jgi:hypothetical protein